jgi:hypothetical protein
MRRIEKQLKKLFLKDRSCLGGLIFLDYQTPQAGKIKFKIYTEGGT